MSFWKKPDMARATPKDDKDTAADTSKPLPEPKRPGTSGTEMVLVTNRRAASQKYQQAARAERTYKARKRSAAARANWAEAKQHLGEAARHFGAGVRLTFSVATSARYVVGEKLEGRRQKVEESKRKKALEKRKKLEERLAREKAERPSEEAEGDKAEGDGKA
jgi:hypothetical protein